MTEKPLPEKSGYIGILGRLTEITDLMRETGCSWDEATHKLDERDSNVIEFRRD